ncbi:lysophospholipid acyltransferase family protein [Flavobacterium sp. '19STA2R22 D10 B1']|uniref:lysophospholipid acyltransferase family protein n=1 Tax=Flavobacterium aerium TaxID=3037261 RepID=UPI00278BB1B7|nr:lysophospholipid acyltransferase family protein [Flavobacterium sp. '19STA2R22 D10 B1']
MQLLAYILLYPIFWCISILPFRLLYMLSDGIYILIYRIIGYRKRTVRDNIAMALPNLSIAERRKIEKDFYHHFCDTFLEMIKTMTITHEEINKRFVFTNVEAIAEMEAKQKSVSFVCAHYASYEWLLVANTKMKFQGYGIYKRIRNKYFDRLVHKIRSKFNAKLIDAKESIQVIKENQQKGILGFYGFVTDQSPKLHRTTHWANFMGIYVPIHTGAEMLAKRMDMNVLFVKTEKVKRGHYQATFIPVEGNIKAIPNYEISEAYLKLLEQQIHEAPAYYLWTHKRWKHRKADPKAQTTA